MGQQPEADTISVVTLTKGDPRGCEQMRLRSTGERIAEGKCGKYSRDGVRDVIKRIEMTTHVFQ